MKTQSLVSLSITDTSCQKNINKSLVWHYSPFIHQPALPLLRSFRAAASVFYSWSKGTYPHRVCHWVWSFTGLVVVFERIKKKSLLSTSASPQPPSSNQRRQGAEEEDGVLLGAMHVDPPVLFAAGKSFSHMMLRHKHICLGIRPAAVYPL